MTSTLHKYTRQLPHTSPKSPSVFLAQLNGSEGRSHQSHRLRPFHHLQPKKKNYICLHDQLQNMLTASYSKLMATWPPKGLGLSCCQHSSELPGSRSRTLGTEYMQHSNHSKIPIVNMFTAWGGGRPPKPRGSKSCGPPMILAQDVPENVTETLRHTWTLYSLSGTCTNQSFCIRSTQYLAKGRLPPSPGKPGWGPCKLRFKMISCSWS